MSADDSQLRSERAFEEIRALKHQMASLKREADCAEQSLRRKRPNGHSQECPTDADQSRGVGEKSDDIVSRRMTRGLVDRRGQRSSSPAQCSTTQRQPVVREVVLPK